MSLTLPEFFVLCGSLFLIGFLIVEMINWGKIITSLESNRNLIVYSDGEDVVESLSAKSSGSFDVTPVNIISRQAVIIEAYEPLEWNGYDVLPIAMTMTNDGESVIIQGHWTRGLIPTIFGGPLQCTYQLHSISLHWGESDEDGTEHSIDQVKYPFEVQLLHMREANQRTIVSETDECDVDAAVVSYLFQIKENDNTELDPIVMNLCRIQDGNTKVYIPPFQLDSLLPLFSRKFYSYNDKLTQTSSEIATWIIYPQPLFLSIAQVISGDDYTHSAIDLVLLGNFDLRVEEFRRIFKDHSSRMRAPGPQDLYYHE